MSNGGVRRSFLLGRGGGEALGDLVPVHDLPDGLEVVWTHILVLQVVCVLPALGFRHKQNKIKDISSEMRGQTIAAKDFEQRAMRSKKMISGVESARAKSLIEYE